MSVIVLVLSFLEKAMGETLFSFGELRRTLYPLKHGVSPMDTRGLPPEIVRNRNVSFNYYIIHQTLGSNQSQD